MGTLRIEQFSGAALDERGIMQMPQLPAIGPAQTIAATAVSAAMATPLDPRTRSVRLRCTGVPIAFTLGAGTPTAVVGDISMDVNEVAWFGVDAAAVNAGNLRIAAIDR